MLMKWLRGAPGTWWWKFIVLGRNATSWALSVGEQNNPEASMGLPASKVRLQPSKQNDESPWHLRSTSHLI
jgi:hypothetical protein